MAVSAVQLSRSGMVKRESAVQLRPMAMSFASSLIWASEISFLPKVDGISHIYVCLCSSPYVRQSSGAQSKASAREVI